MADTTNQEYSRDAGDYNETGDSSSNVEWRSCLQVENGTPSTSPFWDTDSDEDGPKPVELFGKHTWKIENFSKITKRELRSEPFDAGGYKWYILIYPQGCDVCNHISLFLCVANHDKLLPGWSHFAQFTIAVVNKDPKKSKYSDTLHRFWKKEHDWGWKKFMELTKVQDGFLVEGVLVIKAQVQVIREKPDRPFRCLDRLYRRELVRIYMTNIENIYRRFVEEKRNRLSKLIDDKPRWSSFHAFWKGTSTNSRYAMSREKTDTILKILVKQFFIEKEVTSTLVMDSLYSGLRALELQSVAGKKWRGSRPAELERMPDPMVRVEKDMFVLADDVIGLLERAVLEQLPAVKDDKVSQNRTTKDGNTIEETSKDTIERDERRLTEIGRRILEIFTLAHIYSIIEVAYQEAVALKRQEELIREEEAWMNEPDTKSKRDNKDKKSKKKQGKQKKNNKKGKEKEKILDEAPEENENLLEDLNEDISENGEDATNGDDGSNGEVVAADLENVESSPVKDFNFAESEILKDEWTGKKSYSSDNWVPVGSANKGANSSNYKNHTSSPNRAKAQRSKIITEKSIPAPVVINNTNEKVGPTHFVTRSNEQTGPTSFAGNSNVIPGVSSDSSGSNGRATTPQPMRKLENRPIEKEQTIPLQKKLEVKSQPQLQINLPSRPATPKTAPVSSTPNPPEKPSPTITKPFTPLKTTPSPSSATPPNSASFGAVRPVVLSVTPRPTLPTIPPLVPEPVKTVPKPVMLSPSPKPIIAPEPANPLRNTSPIVPPAVAQRPTTPMAAPVQATPYLAPSPPAPSFVPQSYRNAIMGSNGNTSNCPLAGPNPNHPNPLGFSAQAAQLLSRIEAEKAESNLSFFSTSPCGTGWIQNDNGSDNPFCTKTVSQLVAEEFPHLDMINGLLDDLSDGELYCPHNGTVGHPYRPFPKTNVNLASGSGRIDPLRDMGLASGLGRHDLLRNMSFTNGSGRNDPLRDMGLASMTARNDPLREMGLGSVTGRNDLLGDMGLNSMTGRNDLLRDPLREMGLTSGLGRVDPLYEMGVSNASRVYSSSSGGNSSSLFNNLPSYHHVNGHYDYSSDLGMNLNLGAELNNGYGIRDYSNLPGASGINRFRYPYDNGL